MRRGRLLGELSSWLLCRGIISGPQLHQKVENGFRSELSCGGDGCLGSAVPDVSAEEFQIQKVEKKLVTMTQRMDGLALAGGRSGNLVCRGIYSPDPAKSQKETRVTSDNMVCREIPDPKSRKETRDHDTEDGCWSGSWRGGDRGVLEGVIGRSLRG